VLPNNLFLDVLFTLGDFLKDAFSNASKEVVECKLGDLLLRIGQGVIKSFDSDSDTTSVIS
jgi:hypothetical protein